MTEPSPRILQALDRFHAAHPWDHNAHYHRWILRQLPRSFDSALDVGCGSGDLARLLASRARVPPSTTCRSATPSPASASTWRPAGP
ncbi:hypothetical protein [Planotetraspora silvatica]|uniref:hypothetical protein n=1 Tax=Planotetraspora silvatica TaxID=234614 RepID=UPI001EF2CC80|nr:hypothetical protein [Planotetraspora silvatica]